MGYTTFTGPVRAGNILDTTGITPGADVRNVGQVVMAQSAAILEGATPSGSTIAGLTTISIPAYSQILSIEMRTTIPFTNPVSIGNTFDGTTVNSATYFSDPVTLGAAGPTNVSTTTVAQNNVWINSGYPDSQIVVAGGLANGPGRAVLTVTYLQGPNGNT